MFYHFHKLSDDNWQDNQSIVVEVLDSADSCARQIKNRSLEREPRRVARRSAEAVLRRSPPEKLGVARASGPRTVYTSASTDRTAAAAATLWTVARERETESHCPRCCLAFIPLESSQRPASSYTGARCALSARSPSAVPSTTIRARLSSDSGSLSVR